MKKFLTVVGIIIMTISYNSKACTPSEDIKKMDNGNYSITPSCYERFGLELEQNKLLKEKVANLEDQRSQYERLLELSREEKEIYRQRSDYWKSEAERAQTALRNDSFWEEWGKYFSFVAGAFVTSKIGGL